MPQERPYKALSVFLDYQFDLRNMYYIVKKVDT